MAHIILFVLIIVLTINFSKGEVHDDFLHIYHRLKKTNCFDDTGMTQDLLERANKGDFSSDRILKCYMECHMEELEILTDDGLFDYSRIMDLIPDNHKGNMGPIFKECIEISNKEEDQCDRAYKMHTCYHERDPKMYFLA